MDRRLFLGAAFGTAASVALPVSAMSASDAHFWALPRRLRLTRAQTRENFDEVYWADGKIQMPGYLRLCEALRDTRAGKAVYMDPRLLDLMRAVQAYVEYYNYTAPLVINSGYRSPETNQKLEGAAKNSMHLRGKAVDFSMPGLPSEYMGMLASHYQGGGVGFYPTSGFTHMDTGNVRYWGQRGYLSGPKRKK